MAKKIKKYKVGMDSETYAISLVESPAIEEEMIALEKQEPIKIQLANEEKHMVYSAVLIPDKPIYRRNADGDEYYLEFSKESIEKMSQEFLKEYRQSEITVDHNDIAPEVTVVESWLKSDLYKDKSVALGLNESLPIGTWFAGMKVNNVEVWERIKNGELKGFSVESLVSLEDFNKVENNDNDMNDEMLFSKLTNWMKDFFKKEETISVKPEKAELTKEEELAMQSGFTNVEDYRKEVEAIKEEFEEQTPNEASETPVEEPKVEEPTPTPTVEEKAPEEPKNEPTEKDNHLEELINNLKEEIEALKGVNKDLTSKVKKLEAEPSAKPVNTNSKASKGDTYAQWRAQMKDMLGY